MRELLAKEDRCFLFDLMADPKFDSWGVLVDSLEDGVKLALKTKRYRIRMQFDGIEQFDTLCRLHVKKPHGEDAFRNSIIAVDELAMFCSSSWMPEGFRTMIRLGRHTQAGFIATSQRPPDITPFIRSQAKEQYLFQMHEPADLEAFKKRVPNIERVINLKTGEFILWRPDTAQTTGSYSSKSLDSSSNRSPTIASEND